MSHVAPHVLITSSSFLDTPGEHRALVRNSGTVVHEARGPLTKDDLISVITSDGPFDAVLCGEDDFCAEVLEVLAPRCRVLSRYGVGLDKIDLERARSLSIRVTNTPGVSTTAVTELVFGLLIGLAREIPEHNQIVHDGQWQRRVGTELHGKSLGVIGLGQVGRCVAHRGVAFGMSVLAHNSSWSEDHVKFEADLQRHINGGAFGYPAPQFRRVKDTDQVLREADFVTLHVNLNRDTANLIDGRRLKLMKRGALLINVSRGGLVDHWALAEALRNGHLAGYGADVLNTEPVARDEPLLRLPRVLLTPHIGSRTRTSVERQGIAAWNNLIAGLT